MILHIIPEMNAIITIENNIISVFDNYTNNKIYEYKGLFIFRILDNNNFIIYEKNLKDSLNNTLDRQRLVFFGVDKNKEIIVDPFGVKINKTVFDMDLQKQKEMIIHGIYKDFIYSYEYALVMSPFFDRIIFDKENNLFLVEEKINTSHGTITLSGALNIDGFLLNECMYCKELNKIFYIDPFDVSTSIYKLSNKLEKLMSQKTKKDKKLLALDYERNCYLTRKREKK